MQNQQLCVQTLGRGFAWLDTGTYEDLIEAGNFIRTIQSRQSFKIGCPEEVGYRNRWITAEQLIEQGQLLDKSDYGNFLINLVQDQ